MLMTGDAYHHVGELRTSPRLPLPDHHAGPFCAAALVHVMRSPGDKFIALLPGCDQTVPLHSLAAAFRRSWYRHDADDCTLRKVQ